MEENQFISVMREHSDEELLEILNVKRKEYVPDAIAAVEEVLKERGVRYEKVPDEVFVSTEDTTLTIQKIKVSNGKRLLGNVIDVTVITFFNVIILNFTSIVEGNYSNDIELNFLSSIIYFIYFFIMETTKNGKTIGKRLLKMSVTNDRGESPAMSTIALRTICRFIPFDALSFLWGGNWHDSLSGTYVVSDKKLKDFIEQK